MEKKNAIIVAGIIILTVSGCLQTSKDKEPLANVTPVMTPEITAIAQTPTMTSTPLKEFPPNSLYVLARMLKPVDWGSGKYEVKSMKVEIYSQVSEPLSINAQIAADDQILEEKSLYLRGEGSNYQFMNEKAHFVNNTNMTLRLLVRGYQPVEYRFREVDTLS